MKPLANMVADFEDSAEKIPAWADALMKSHKAVLDRLDAMERDGGEDPTLNTNGARRDYAAPTEDPTLNTNGQRRADSYQSAANRAAMAKIAALEHQMRRVTAEAPADDRNQIAEARSRADSVFQAALGRTVPDPVPGERPIAYRRRLADALKKFSPTLSTARLDSVAGAALDVVETRIYADALEAVKTPAVMAAGQIRAIKKRELGHEVTEYVGDPQAAWAPFGHGSGGKVAFNHSLTRH
ncbi:hypothetical protein [Acidiphilium acidophilum]|uniref:Uncharacterized protein n=1 Tax=Acidiphilium acidophilum TaxID=76588 RepID=A0AAW9DP80_ACIAO|nr:hypothetical protein [Acidiphilium acidophilum]MDX5930503.1 hypothetical protein [Acidiphilium acidophilum]